MKKLKLFALTVVALMGVTGVANAASAEMLKQDDFVGISFWLVSMACLAAMNIYVGNISWGMSDQDLENLFAEHGTVTSAKIITDRMTNRSRGFGFVEMSDGAEAAIAALNEAEVEGRKLVVNESRPKETR
jgi:hypothetical protein